MKRLHLIGNRLAAEALKVFSSRGYEVVELSASSIAASTAAISEAITSDGAERVIVVGGDGAVHAAVNAIAPLRLSHPNVVLGIIPLGTGNDFARALNIPLGDETAAAIHALRDGQSCDLIETNFGWIASVATCGYPAKVNRRANQMRWPKGSSKYTLATLQMLPRLRSDTITMTLDGGTPIAYDLSILAVGNTDWFGGGMHVCPGASAHDGIAEIVRVRKLGRLELLRFLPLVFSGKHAHNRRTTVEQARTIRLDGAADIELWGDGELVGPLPMTLRVVADAIRVAYLV